MRAKLISGVAQAFLALGLLPHTNPAYSAHLYAAVPGAIQVYDIAANGTLSSRQSLATPAVKCMAATPNGRFLYTTDGWHLYAYAIQDNGTIQASGAPLALSAQASVGADGIRDLAIHQTTGGFLYVLTQLAVLAYQIDSSDGRLTPGPTINSFIQDQPSFSRGSGPNFRHLAAHPYGDYLVVTGNIDGLIGAWAIQTFPDGSFGGNLGTAALHDSVQYYGDAAADARFSYVRGWMRTTMITDGRTLDVDCDLIDVLQTGAPLALEKHGTTRIGGWGGEQGACVLHSTRDATGARLLAVGDRYLAYSSGGKTSTLTIFAVNGGNTFYDMLGAVDQAPIEVYALGTGRGAWNNTLWVATDDGIVTYSLANLNGPYRWVQKWPNEPDYLMLVNTGRLQRISKMMVRGAFLLAFSPR